MKLSRASDWRRKRAIALFVTLWLMVILAIMAISLVRLARGQSLTALYHYRQALALQAAEAGLAHALAKLRQDPGWNQGFSNQFLADGEASYRINFSAGPTFDTTDSVNNLAAAIASDGPRGPLCVPAASAWLVVEGRSGEVRKVLEVVVGRSAFPQVDVAILGSGRIRMQGAVRIDGQENSESPVVPAGLHSNLASAGADPSIEWTALGGGDEALISGQVTTSDTRPVNEAIRFTGAHTLGGSSSNAGDRALSRFDIPAMIAAAQSGATTPSFNPGETVLAAGKHFVDGPLMHPGDIRLEEGAELYVRGNLDLAGSIRGQGAVIVEGTTHLRGDVQLNAESRVALLSQGDVHLEGFNASGYLEGIAGSQPIVDTIRTAMDRIVELCESGDPAVMGSLGELDQANHILNNSGMTTYQGLPGDQLNALRNLILAQPAGDERREFLVKKLETLIAYHDHGGGNGSTRRQAVSAFLANPSTGQAKVVEALSDDFGNLQSDFTAAELGRALRLAAQVSRASQLNRLTTSYFNGLVYTQGDFLADKELYIVGALIADGTTAKGNITLKRGTQVTFLKELFDSPDALNLPGALEVQTWSLR